MSQTIQGVKERRDGLCRKHCFLFSGPQLAHVEALFRLERCLSTRHYTFSCRKTVTINIQIESVHNGNGAHNVAQCTFYCSGPVYAPETYLFWQEAVFVNPSGGGKMQVLQEFSNWELELNPCKGIHNWFLPIIWQAEERPIRATPFLTSFSTFPFARYVVNIWIHSSEEMRSLFWAYGRPVLKLWWSIASLWPQPHGSEFIRSAMGPR